MDSQLPRETSDKEACITPLVFDVPNPAMPPVARDNWELDNYLLFLYAYSLAQSSLLTLPSSFVVVICGHSMQLSSLLGRSI